MRSAPSWLTLEVKYPDRATAFYEAFLELDVITESADEAVLAAGDTELRLRAPGTVPRGGLHTQYTLAVPGREYDDWYDRLDERFELTEHSVDGRRSLYFYDPQGNCVGLSERATDGQGVAGLVELVLEVEDLPAAVEFYTALGFDVAADARDDGRVRLSAGEFDLELWSPRLGVADARGGVHVDFGVVAEDPDTAAEAVSESALSVASVDEGVRIRDPDGHHLTLASP